MEINNDRAPRFNDETAVPDFDWTQGEFLSRTPSIELIEVVRSHVSELPCTSVTLLRLLGSDHPGIQIAAAQRIGAGLTEHPHEVATVIKNILLSDCIQRKVGAILAVGEAGPAATMFLRHLAIYLYTHEDSIRNYAAVTLFKLVGEDKFNSLKDSAYRTLRHLYGEEVHGSGALAPFSFPINDEMIRKSILNEPIGTI